MHEWGPVGTQGVQALGMLLLCPGRNASANPMLWKCIPVQVNMSIASWNTTKWSELNVEDMDIECKKFAKDIRGLDKEVKGWNAFTGLDSSMKNMMTSLRAVSELQNPAIRDRHWQELVQTAKVPPSPLPIPAQEPSQIHTQHGTGAVRFKTGHVQIFVWGL